MLALFFLEGEKEQNAVLEHLKLLLMCLPYLVDLVAGVVTVQLFISMRQPRRQSHAGEEAKHDSEELMLPELQKYASNHDQSRLARTKYKT